MVLSLVTSLIATTCTFLYPAYASYKALSLPPTAPDTDVQLARWLMYWAVVGSWTAVESAIGWSFTWIPFYNLVKSLIFLYLALPGSEGAAYIYHNHLAPFYESHERDIDTFLASLRTRAGSAVAEGLGWLWDKVRAQMNIALPHEGQDTARGPYPGEPYPAVGMVQPPTLQDPASGAAQQVFGFISRYAGAYLPVAAAAIAGRREAPAPVSQRAEQVPSTMSMPTPAPHREPSDQSIRSRTASYAMQSQSQGQASLGVSSARRDAAHAYQGGGGGNGNGSARSSSESLGSRMEMSYEQINRDEVGSYGDHPPRPGMARDTSSASGRWFSWGSPEKEREKTE